MYTIYSEEYLVHHGILGMKWGVRRYQNADGSLTKQGLEHYRNSETRHDKAQSEYKSAKERYKADKTAENKSAVKEAKKEVKSAKKQMSKDYDQLKKDRMADKGKDLYQRGKTITGNARTRQIMETVAVGSLALAGILHTHGKDNLALASIGAGVGLEAIGAIKGLNDYFDDKYLRAYYAHNRNK